MNRRAESPYMQWAKLRSSARFNLASSGVLPVRITEFPLAMEELEITGPDAYGYTPLLERIARHSGVEPNCIATAAGTSMANHFAMAAVLGPGDEVVIEQPAYGPLLEVSEYLGARVRRIQRGDRFEVDPEQLERTVSSHTRLIVLTNLHNPSGMMIDAGTLRAIGQIAERVGARVLVDEVYLEMFYDHEPPSVAREGDPFIVTSSLTKGYGLSGLRCGWIVAAPELAQRIWKLNDLFGVNAAHLAERASVVAFDRLAELRERARTLLRTNRALLDSFLDSRDDLDCVRPPVGSVVFPRLRNGDTAEFVQLLRDRYETSVVPGEFFEMPQHFRIGIGGDTAEVAEGLNRVAAALDQFAGTAS